MKQELDKIHWQLFSLNNHINDMSWGKSVNRKTSENIRYIQERIQSIDNQVYELSSSK